MFVILLLVISPIAILGYNTKKKKRKCPYCVIYMKRIKEKEKVVYHCFKCHKKFKDRYDKPKKKIGTQNYMNLNWLRQQYYDLGRTLQDIADEQKVSIMTIKKWVDKIDNATYDKED